MKGTSGIRAGKLVCLLIALLNRPSSGTLDTITQDDRIQWPDSMDVSPDDFLYFTTSQIHRMPHFNNGRDERIIPYKLFKIGLETF